MDTGHSAVFWTGDKEFCRCPTCGYQDDLDGFDVLGADEGCVFCNNCQAEFDLRTSAVIVKDGET